MKKLNVTLKSTVPMLMHRYEIDTSEKKTTARKDKIYDAKTDAEKAMYKDEKGCYIPSEWIESTMKEAAKSFKDGKSTMKNKVQSAVMVDNDKIYLNKQTYDEIDSRPVVIQRNRIVRSRPKFNNWEVSFSLSYDENRIEPKAIKDILTEAGSCKGIGDYRPKFGRFEVKDIKE